MKLTFYIVSIIAICACSVGQGEVHIDDTVQIEGVTDSIEELDLSINENVLDGTEYKSGWYDLRYLLSFNYKLKKYTGYIRYGCKENENSIYSLDDCDCALFFISSERLNSDGRLDIVLYDSSHQNQYEGVVLSEKGGAIIKNILLSYTCHSLD